MRRDDGYTLIELLVAVALMLVVLGAVLAVFEVFARDNRYGQLRNETQDNARTTMDRLSHELRSLAAPGTKSAGALEAAAPTSLIFEVIDSSSASSTSSLRVRYCLDDSEPANEVLWRQVKAEPFGGTGAQTLNEANCPDRAAGHWDSRAQLVQHVVNRIGGEHRALFKYVPAGWSSVSQIVGVEPTLYLDPAPGSRPGETQLTTSITLRNENRPPAASFSAVELGASRIVSLNASESTDPDGLALTYAWWDNAKKQPTTSQSWETSALVAGSSHTFKLEVADPGGLTSSTERTVVIK